MLRLRNILAEEGLRRTAVHAHFMGYDFNVYRDLEVPARGITRYFGGKQTLGEAVDHLIKEGKVEVLVDKPQAGTRAQKMYLVVPSDKADEFLRNMKAIGLRTTGGFGYDAKGLAEARQHFRPRPGIKPRKKTWFSDLDPTTGEPRKNLRKILAEEGLL